MTEDQDNNLGSMIGYGGLNLAAVALLLVLFFRPGADSTGDSVVQLTTGEWEPYSGETLSDSGFTSAVVTTVLAHQGYETRLSFVPWSQAPLLAEAGEYNRDFRGTFPYIWTPSREREFYFSLPLMEVDYSVFFNPDSIDPQQLHNKLQYWQGVLAEAEDKSYDIDSNDDGPTALDNYRDQLVEQLRDRLAGDDDVLTAVDVYRGQLDEQLQDRLVGADDADGERIIASNRAKFDNLLVTMLSLEDLNIRIRRIEGYESPPVLEHLMATESSVARNNSEAFEWLASSNPAEFDTLENETHRIVVIEATSVARSQLVRRFPREYQQIFDARDSDGSTRQDSEIVYTNSEAARFFRAPLGYEIDVYLMAGKRNPENFGFIRNFNEQLLTLTNNGTVDSLVSGEQSIADEQQRVTLHAVSVDGYLRGYTQNTRNNEFYLLLNGTEAILLEWDTAYLSLQTGEPQQTPRVKVRVSEGPHFGQEMYVDAASVTMQ